MTDLDAWSGLGLLIFALIFGAVAYLGASGKRHDRVVREGGTVFLAEKLMQGGYSVIEAFAGIAVRLKVTAMSLSWASLVLGVLSGVFAAFRLLGCSAWFLALSGLCDGLDGLVARTTHSATRAGAILDSVLDRYVEFFFCAGLVYCFRGSACVQLAVLAALFGGFMVTYSTAKAEALQMVPPRAWMKRSERLVWFIATASVAAAARYTLISPERVVLIGATTIALFSNLSAVLRLRSLAQEALTKE